MDVRVDGGPQDGTILVTWIPATNVSIAAKMAPVTGYAVFADGKRVTDVDSPTSRHTSSPRLFCAHHFCPKSKMLTFSQAHSHASTNTTRRHEYFSRTEQTFASARSFGAIS